MAKPKTPPESIITRGGPTTAAQAYQLEVQRGLRARAAAAATAAKMGGPPRDLTSPAAFAGPGRQIGVDQHGFVLPPVNLPQFGGHGAPAASGQEDPSSIKAMQEFLVRKGYNISADGIAGPETKAAAADWTSKRNPGAWNQQHTVGGAGAAGPNTPEGAGARSSYTPAATVAAANSGAGVGADTGAGAGQGASFTDLFAAMLGGANTANLLPTSLADSAAAGDNALVTTLQQELANLPTAKANALANIAKWYGDVSSSEKTAATRDQAMANAGSAADTSNTAGIMASLGGSAMGGNNMIGATGANDANTLSAQGVNDAQLSADLAPLFASEQANAATTMSNKFDAGQTDLNAQLAQATGKAAADKAAALEQIIQANNSARNTNFSNKASLLQTLAGLQISGIKADTAAQSAATLNALRNSEITKNNAAARAKASPSYATATAAQKHSAYQAILSQLVDPNTHTLASGLDKASAVRAAAQAVRSYGYNPLDPQVLTGLLMPALTTVGLQFGSPQMLQQYLAG